MKKVTATVFVLMTMFALVSCGSSGKEEAQTTPLGTSSLSIVLPEGYAAADDDFAEDQVAYFYKDDESIDFDVYQWAKEGIYTLEDEAEHFAGEYGTAAEAVEINDIPGMKYISKEAYDGYEYTVVNYMFEDADSIVELCFWTVDTQEEYEAVDEIISTLSAG